jgi:hypothetical protein
VSFEWHAKTPLEFIVFFLLLWSGVSLLLSMVSGWRTLAEAYRLDGDFEGARWWFKSANLRSVNYSNCLTLGANERGLYVGILFPFRLGHPPLFIPWSDVSAVEARGWLFRYVDLTFLHAPGIRFRITHRFGTSLLHAGGRELRIMREIVA